MITVIAEKPSVARDLASHLKANNKQQGYFEGNGYFVTYAFGHLVGLAAPEEYGYASFSKSALPMLPSEFKLSVVPELVNGKRQESKSARAQLSIINKLFNQSEEIIVATDAGREGELIFRNIYNYLKCRVPFKRLWISSLTQQAIADGFSNLQNGKDYDNLFYSAEARSQADWLLGLNATTAITIANQNRTILSLGRVQTPTLCLIIQRYLENKNFVKTPYFVVKGFFEKDGIRFVANSDQYKDRTQVPNVQSIQGNPFQITEATKTTVNENAPLLHDLSSLQQLANKKYGYSADEVLKIMQVLYESKYITYPRTGSRYIGDDIFKEIPLLLSKIKSSGILNDAQKFYISKALTGELNTRSVNASKVTDHHAVLVTDYFPEISKLKENQKNVYNLVLQRVLEAFSAKAIKDKTKIILTHPTIQLKATGSIIKQNGWLEVETLFNPTKKNTEKDNEEQEDENDSLPPLNIGDVIVNNKLEILSKETKPKPFHTEGTLLQAMETSGQEVDDEELRETLKDIGIGTPATRASIIETLFSRKYIVKEKKYLVPTELALFIYSHLQALEICKVDLTGKWEQKLNEIASGKITKDIFDVNIRKFTERIVGNILALQSVFENAAIPGLTKSNTKAEILCPKCKKSNLVEGKSSYFCAEVLQKNCNFSINKVIAQYNLTENIIKELCLKKKSSLIKGFVSKGNKKFEARLLLTDDFKIEFAFDTKRK
ncbi:type IA DNA topoisomerase [Sphingobacterium sp. FBM7-1]|uniref:type IA DNA topoisomerase n=1 Tax=Sphingobacterium sp. FBM7-1 TaxID=2886688 RepID=UPI001D12706A|nr:type IA DNA topoisomerase [Sphingobacterium sp. FBM7-1]MCC2600818.1 DNA topoisomerase III [Sphingobacterium sp. FBM7-1]